MYSLMTMMMMTMIAIRIRIKSSRKLYNKELLIVVVVVVLAETMLLPLARIIADVAFLLINLLNY